MVKESTSDVLTYDLSFKVICDFQVQTNHALSPLLWPVEMHDG